MHLYLPLICFEREPIRITPYSRSLEISVVVLAFLLVFFGVFTLVGLSYLGFLWCCLLFLFLIALPCLILLRKSSLSPYDFAFRRPKSYVHIAKKYFIMAFKFNPCQPCCVSLPGDPCVPCPVDGLPGPIPTYLYLRIKGMCDELCLNDIEVRYKLNPTTGEYNYDDTVIPCKSYPTTIATVVRNNSACGPCMYRVTISFTLSGQAFGGGVGAEFGSVTTNGATTSTAIFCTCFPFCWKQSSKFIYPYPISEPFLTWPTLSVSVSDISCPADATDLCSDVACTEFPLDWQVTFDGLWGCQPPPAAQETTAIIRCLNGGLTTCPTPADLPNTYLTTMSPRDGVACGCIFKSVTQCGNATAKWTMTFGGLGVSLAGPFMTYADIPWEDFDCFGPNTFTCTGILEGFALYNLVGAIVEPV